jgi:CheY-like chemotaxis protein
MACILFIDDDFDTLDTYNNIASLFGHKALLAEHGEQALEMIRASLPDLIIVDLNLPDMDGFELMRTLRADETVADIPIVMVTASPETFARRAEIEGAQKFLTKPLMTEDLLTLVDEYITD